MINGYEEARKKYKSRRLVEGYLFLKSLSSNEFESGNSQLVASAVHPKLEENARNSSIETLLSNVPLDKRKPALLHSVSITAAANVDDEIHLQKYRSDDNKGGGGLFELNTPSMLRSKSTIETSKDLKNRIKLTTPNRMKHLNEEAYGKRLVLTSKHKAPYCMFSVIPYTKNKHQHNEKNTSGHYHAHHSTNLIDNVDIGDGKREVSFWQLLIPENWKRQRNQDHENDKDFNEYHLVDYDPMMLDDPELTCGKHRKVLTLSSYTVSIIQYAKPSAVKKDINEQFREKHPNLTITLTKLRSLKAEIVQIAHKMNLDMAVIAGAFVYFEKVILKTRIHKNNRKCIAGASLLLSIKFFDDVHGKNIKGCIEAIQDQLRISHKELLSCELQLLVLLEFALQIPANEVIPTYKRLENSLS
eukprot:TCONS_00004080-protein